MMVPICSRNLSISKFRAVEHLNPSSVFHLSKSADVAALSTPYGYRVLGVAILQASPLCCHTGRWFVKNEPVGARDMFVEIPYLDYRAYNRKIRDFTSEHQYYEAMLVFKWMQSVRLRPDSFALAAVVKSSALLLNAHAGKTIHGYALKVGYATSAAVQKALMDMYARCGTLGDSFSIFTEMDQRDSVSWNVLLTGCVRAELHEKAMQLFYSMHSCGLEEIKATSVTIAVILPVCAKFPNLCPGRSIHAYVIKMGLESDTLVGNALISMYSRCGIMSDARKVFSLSPHKDVISWNSVIAGYSENKLFDEALKLLRQMTLNSILPNCTTITIALPVCSFLEDSWFTGRELHCHALRFGFEKDLTVCNALMTYYSKIGNMKGAEFVFKSMHSVDLISWNTMIAGYALNGWHSQALVSFHELFLRGTKPDSVTFISLLPVCAELSNVQEGKKIHGYVLKHPMLYNETSLCNALISFYGKCGEVEDALQAFLGTVKKDIISWNAILSAYSDNNLWEKFSNLFNLMHQQGIEPDFVTVLCVLQATTSYGLKKVREAHAYSFRAGFMSQMNIGNAIIDSYAKCGSIEDSFRTFKSLSGKNIITGNTMISGYLNYGSQDDAESIFNQMSEKDITTWNLMIQIYVQNDCIDHAFNLFHQLQGQGMRPDSLSIISVLPACVRMASVHLVRQCDCYRIRAFLDDMHLEGALIDSYSKCGSINYAYKLFQASSEKDLITYSAMVGGYAMHGMAEEAILVFSQMLESGVKPDHVILTSLLSACSHAGLVDEGWNIFMSMIKIHDINPTEEHYACMVDLLARGGRLREAYNFIRDMPCEANANVWGTLLGACKTHKEVEIGKLVADHLFEVETGNIGNYIVMSNIYAADGRWNFVEQVRKLMKTKDLKKPAGCSWVEVESKRHVFVAADIFHPQRPFIYHMLGILDQHMKQTFLDCD